jgi:hypothetical protein
VLAWNFAVDRLINAPDTDPVEFERACHDEASGCAYSRVWRAYLDVIQDAARRRFLSGPKLLGKVLGAGVSAQGIRTTTVPAAVHAADHDRGLSASGFRFRRSRSWKPEARVEGMGSGFR